MTKDFNFTYSVTLQKQKEGGYLVRFPDFPEAITQGEKREEALQEATDCLEEAVANRIVMGLDIPFSSHTSALDSISLDITLAAKCALYLAMRKRHYKNVELAKMLKCDEKEVRRLLDPRYKSKIPRIEEALNLLGERLTLSVTSDNSINNLPTPTKYHGPHYHRPAAGL